MKKNLGRDNEIFLTEEPNICPYCHKSIVPIFLQHNIASEELELIYKCPNDACNKTFIGYFLNNVGTFVYTGSNIGTLKIETFSEEIYNISSSFVKIYNEALFAEQNNLKEICGVGYRKALEFLIKDYLTKKKPENKTEIKSKFLGNCIKDYVEDTKIKSVAERAVWLGNDETHYVKIWEEQSLADLKKLIQLTIHWIEMEELTNSFEKKMPNKK